MNKNYLAIITVIVILGSGLIWITNKEKQTENALEASIVSISQTDSFYNIQAEYPQFKGVEPAFNEKISGLVNEQIDAFKKSSKENWDARRATAPSESPLGENPDTPFDFIASWAPTQLNNQYLSFALNMYYFSGGAHGITLIDTFNYDMVNKKEIAITDFLGSQASLEKLSELAKQQVTSQIESTGAEIDDILTQMIQSGTQPTEDNYKNFNFTYNSLIIYFQQYQVAPGYLGPMVVTLYKNALLQKSINSDYLK